MGRLDIKDIPDKLMVELDRQRTAIGIGNRSDYIKLLINIDIIHKVTIQLHHNKEIDKKLEEAERKINQLQQHQSTNLEHQGDLQDQIKKLRRSNASYQDENVKLRQQLEGKRK